jgi:hypothetical protein
MTAAAPEDFVGRLVDVARAAVADGPARTLTLRPAGVPVRVHLAGAELIDRLAPGMLEASIEGGDALAIELWAFDGAGTGRAAPPPPWGPQDYLQREEIAGWTRPPHLASYSTDYATLSVADTAGLGVQWLRDASAMAPWEGGAPLRSILRWTLERHGVHLIHAAAVGNGAEGVLLLGSGGAGKSTTALACLRAGMALVADDYTLIRPGSPPTAHPAFAIAKAAPASLELLGGGGEDLHARAVGARVDWRGKLRLPIADVVCPSLSLRAIVLPRVAERTGLAVPYDAREALRGIAVSTLLQLPGDSATTLSVLRELLATLPVYALEVGPDVDAIPEAIGALIATLTTEAAA